MPRREREAATEYFTSRRQMAAAWEDLQRRANRHALIHARLAVVHAMSSVILASGEEPGNDALNQFLSLAAGALPLEKAGGFDEVIHPPELRDPAPPDRRNLSEAVEDWFFTSTVSRERAYEQVLLAQDSVNAAAAAMEQLFPGFLTRLNR